MAGEGQVSSGLSNEAQPASPTTRCGSVPSQGLLYCATITPEVWIRHTPYRSLPLVGTRKSFVGVNEQNRKLKSWAHNTRYMPCNNITHGILRRTHHSSHTTGCTLHHTYHRIHTTHNNSTPGMPLSTYPFIPLGIYPLVYTTQYIAHNDTPHNRYQTTETPQHIPHSRYHTTYLPGTAGFMLHFVGFCWSPSFLPYSCRLGVPEVGVCGVYSESP